MNSLRRLGKTLKSRRRDSYNDRFVQKRRTCQEAKEDEGPCQEDIEDEEYRFHEKMAKDHIFFLKENQYWYVRFFLKTNKILNKNVWQVLAIYHVQFYEREGITIYSQFSRRGPYHIY